MKIITLVGFFIMAIDALGQKPAIDTTAFTHWSSVDNPVVSDDGNYFCYNILGAGTGNISVLDTLIIKSIKGKEEKHFSKATGCIFNVNSKLAFFQKANDTLCILKLEDFSEQNIAGVRIWELQRAGGKEWLIYRKNNSSDDLIVNEPTGKNYFNKQFKDVSKYYFINDGLILERSNKSGESLYWVDLSGGSEKEIWEGGEVESLILDREGKQLAFIDGKDRRKIWHYGLGTANAKPFGDDAIKKMEKELQIQALSRFGKNGKKIFFSAIESSPPMPSPKIMTKVVSSDVWSYLDPKLQSQQSIETQSLSNKNTAPYNFVLIADENKITRINLLKYKDEKMHSNVVLNDDVIIISKGPEILERDERETWSTVSNKRSYYLVDVLTGGRIPIPFLGMVSPDKKYIIGRSEEKQKYLCYEVKTHQIRDLTGVFGVTLIDSLNTSSVPISITLDLIGWIKGSNKVLLSDKYDVWMIDLEDTKHPVCLTKGIGRKENIIFKSLDRFHTLNFTIEKEILFLSTFNLSTKERGFCSISWKNFKVPKIVTVPGYFVDFSQKAKNAPIWIVTKENASESPNYYWTSDFKGYERLSDVQPERKYNWITSELFPFKTLAGMPGKAILYKPENFDPAKKYPVIVHYYEQRTDNLYGYMAPKPIGWDINIPWFVSRGYVVLEPDIIPEFKNTGKCALNSIVGATEELIKSPWVDKKKIGLQGHSFGGFETNYVITHSNLFAAAMSSAGLSDFISGYGTISFGGKHAGMWFENGQPRMQCSLWEDPKAYIDNSPIFNADKITCPVLMMHNKEDSAAPFDQGVELFTALRRLGKRGWMLQYDGEKHVLLNNQNQRLHTTRITQFFDHYLRDTPAPKWMTRGIPASKKGIDDGLELDTEIKTPPEGGLLTNEEKKKIEVYSKIPFEQKLTTPAPSKN